MKKKETIKKILKRYEGSTLEIKKRGKYYCVRDFVEFDGDYGCMSARKLRERFG